MTAQTKAPRHMMNYDSPGQSDSTSDSTANLPTSQVVIVIVSYNTSKDIKNCLTSLFEHSKADLQVVVVDNASKDDSVKMLKRDFPQVHLIESSENLGFAKACNLAIKETQSEYVCLLNPDTILYSDAISELIAFDTRRPDAGLVGGRAIRPDGTNDISSCWGLPTMWSTFCFASGLAAFFPDSHLFNPEVMSKWLRDSEREVGFITGFLLLARRSVWNELNGFDELFWLYSEDADLCKRAHDAGYHPSITPNATLEHIGGTASATSARRIIMTSQGRVTYMRKHWGKVGGYVGTLLYEAGIGVRAVAEKMGVSLAQERIGPVYVETWRAMKDWHKGY